MLRTGREQGKWVSEVGEVARQKGHTRRLASNPACTVAFVPPVPHDRGEAGGKSEVARKAKCARARAGRHNHSLLRIRLLFSISTPRAVQPVAGRTAPRAGSGCRTFCASVTSSPSCQARRWDPSSPLSTLLACACLSLDHPAKERISWLSGLLPHCISGSAPFVG